MEHAWQEARRHDKVSVRDLIFNLGVSEEGVELSRLNASNNRTGRRKSDNDVNLRSP